MSLPKNLKNRWTFAKSCKNQQLAYKAFMGDQTAIHDLYALAKARQRSKATRRSREKMIALGIKPSWDGSKKAKP